MKSLVILLLSAVPVWSASTETCPTVENGVWMEQGINLISKSQLFEYEMSTWTHQLYAEFELSQGVTSPNGKSLYIITDEFRLWRKVPYKIEWECRKSTYRYNSEICKKLWERYLEPHFTTEVRIEPGCDRNEICTQWIGFREDGMVIWKKEIEDE